MRSNLSRTNLVGLPIKLTRNSVTLLNGSDTLDEVVVKVCLVSSKMIMQSNF
jgi:hypothetical protein